MSEPRPPEAGTPRRSHFSDRAAGHRRHRCRRAGFGLLWFSKPPTPGIDLSDLLSKHPQDYALSFGHFLDLTPQEWAYSGPASRGRLALLLGTFANWLFRRRGSAGAGNAVLAAMMIGILACVHSAFTLFSPILIQGSGDGDKGSIPPRRRDRRHR